MKKYYIDRMNINSEILDNIKKIKKINSFV
jgi:hypothetical protein